MVLIDSVKYACATCIKGHRSSSCQHADRQLFEIKKKGRPVTQCVHCRELRKTKQVHVKCLCEAKPSEPTSSTVILPIDSPIHLHPQGFANAGSSCKCETNGSCNCCTPRNTSKPKQLTSTTHLPDPGVMRPDLCAMPIRGSQVPPTGPSPSSNLQRSSSLSPQHPIQLHHHAKHFAPYQLPNHTPTNEVEKVNDAVSDGWRDGRPPVRNRSYSSVTRREYELSPTSSQVSQAPYPNSVASASTPDSSWYEFVAPPTASSEGADPSNNSRPAVLPDGDIGKFRSRPTSPYTMVFDEVAAAPYTLDGVYDASQPDMYTSIPELRLEYALNSEVDASETMGTNTLGTISYFLNTPRAVLHESPSSSGPPSMTGSATSRSSSRNSDRRSREDTTTERNSSWRFGEGNDRGRPTRDPFVVDQTQFYDRRDDTLQDSTWSTKMPFRDEQPSVLAQHAPHQMWENSTISGAELTTFAQYLDGGMTFAAPGGGTREEFEEGFGFPSFHSPFSPFNSSAEADPSFHWNN